MFRAKLVCLGALLTALSTTSLRADLVLIDSSDSRDSFSATFQWTPDQGSSSFHSPDGVFWDINIHDGSVGTYLLIMVGHGFPNMAEPIGFWVTPNVNMGFISQNHPDGPFGHNDVFMINVSPVPQNPGTLLVQLEGHSERSVPDAASSVMLLGLGLTALGALGRRITF